MKLLKCRKNGEYFYKIGVRKGIKDKKQTGKTYRFDWVKIENFGMTINTNTKHHSQRLKMDRDKRIFAT